VCAQTDVELAMKFWSEIAPLELACFEILARWCPQRLRAGRGRRRKEEGGVAPFLIALNLETLI